MKAQQLKRHQTHSCDECNSCLLHFTTTLCRLREYSVSLAVLSLALHFDYKDECAQYQLSTSNRKKKRLKEFENKVAITYSKQV